MSGIVRGGWRIMLPRDDELPPLHRAARQGDLEQVSQCLASGADGNSLAIVQRSDAEIEWMQQGRAESCFPVLHAAVLGGQIAVISKLLDSGADPNIRWHCVSLGCHLLTVGDFGTALVLAARANRTDIMTLLMERGVSPDADPEILPELAEENQAHALQLLIKRTALSVDRDALLDRAVQFGARDVLRLLLAEGIYPANETSPLTSAFYAAAERGKVDIVRILMNQGVTREETQEAFRIACRSKNSTLSVLRLLLKRGATLRQDNEDTSPELLNAVQLQKRNRAQLLLANGAPVNGRYRYPYVDRRIFRQEFFAQYARPPAVYGQMTLLMLAGGQGAVSLCRLWLKYGADPNARDAEGYTPLWYAMLERTGVPRLREVDPEEQLPEIDLPGVIRLLLSHGADADARDPQNRTLRERIQEMHSETAAVYPTEYIRAMEAALERSRDPAE